MQELRKEDNPEDWTQGEGKLYCKEGKNMGKEEHESRNREGRMAREKLIGERRGKKEDEKE